MSYRGNTDRRFNDWHYTLPSDWSYIDLDGMEVCARCRAPLLLYEVTRDAAKATSIVCALADRASLPAVLIVLPETDGPLRDDSVVRWHWLRPRRAWMDAALSDWKRSVAELRRRHDEHCEAKETKAA